MLARDVPFMRGTEIMQEHIVQNMLQLHEIYIVVQKVFQ